MPPKLPPEILEGLSTRQARAAWAWWRGLSPAVRDELGPLWDGRNDSSAYLRTVEPGGEAGWQKLAIRVEGRFVDREEREAREEFPNIDFYEYLVNHELMLDEHHPHHICSAHEDARAAVRAGFIPASFACPFARAGCPMRGLLELSPGRSLALSARPALPCGAPGLRRGPAPPAPAAPAAGS